MFPAYNTLKFGDFARKVVDIMKGRILSFVLYPDHADSMKFLNYVCAYRSSAWILHDRDYESEGVLKPAHFHVMITFPNAVEAGRLSDDGKHTGYCKIVSECCHRTVRVDAYTSISESIMYFIHEDFQSLFNPLKYHYGIKAMCGSYGILKHYKTVKYDEEEILMGLEQLALNKRMLYADLWSYCMRHRDEQPELFHVFNKYSRQIESLLLSVRYDGSTYYGKDLSNFSPDLPCVGVDKFVDI